MIIESIKKYIHYGSEEFKDSLWIDITNDWVKPRGGLWASPIDGDRTWKDWNEYECFVECDDACSFRFSIKPGYKVLYLKSFEDFKEIESYVIKGDVNNLNDRCCFEFIHLDFEKLLRDGISAVEVRHNYITNNAFHCWDCDSIVILNKDCIHIEEE